jgi:hypothetical protein
MTKFKIRKEFMAIRITCINKSDGNHDDPNEAISKYGWIQDGTGKSNVSDRQEVVKWVKFGLAAYVIDGAGNKVYCDVRVSRRGTEFLQTHSDGRWTNNLLELAECG